MGVLIVSAPSDDLPTRIKATVRAVEPHAMVILYGSRARGTARPDSDWDLLILLHGAVDTARKRAIRRPLYELEWQTGAVITSSIKSREAWEDPRFKVSPFYLAVEREGIAL